MRTVCVPLREARGSAVLAGVLLAALLSGLLTACNGDSTAGAAHPSPEESPSTFVVTPIPEPPGIRLSFIQQRFDEGTAKAGITVRNHSGHAMAVRKVGLDWPGYPGPPQRRPYLVPDGLEVDLRYWLPEPDCSGHPRAEDAVSVVVTRSGTVRRRLDAEGVRFLSRIWAADCGARMLARVATLRYVGPWRKSPGGDEPVLTGGVEVTRRSGRQPVTLFQVQGSPLFDLALGIPDTLRPGDRRAVVPLEVRSGGRCDPHSRAAVTTPFTFRIWVRVGGQEVTRVAVPGKAAQRQMLAFLDRVCAAQ
jgi:hypothetical protein